MDNSSKVIFLLGSRRSGTTWLGNIMGNSRYLFYLYEPFERGLGLFDDFPPEYIYLPESKHYEKLLREKISSLWRYRSLLFNPNRLDLKKQMCERQIMRFINKLNRRLFQSRRLDFANRYLFINQQREEFAQKQLRRRSFNLSTIAIKETRMHLKLQLLNHAFPEGYFVFILRHPGGIVQSTLNWMNKGHLSELKGYLEIFPDIMRTQSHFERYWALIEKYSEGSLQQKLALYWRITNEIALSELQKIDKSICITLEELSLRPFETCRKIFDFLDLKFDDEVQKYIQESTTAQTEKPNIVDTRKNSKKYYRKWQDDITSCIYDEIMEIVKESFLIEKFSSYY